MYKIIRRRSTFLLLVVLLSVPVKWPLVETSPPIVMIDPPQLAVDPGITFTTGVSIREALDLGAYEFEIGFDPSVIQVVNVEDGGFLGSTGRMVFTVEPEIDNLKGTVAFAAASGGTAPGPEGDGELAVVTWEAVGVGTTHLDLREVIVLDTTVTEQTVTAEDGRVQVGSGPTSTLTPGPTEVATATPTGTPAATATSASPRAPTPTSPAGSTPEQTPPPGPTPRQTIPAGATASPTGPPGPAETATAVATGRGGMVETPTPTGAPLPTWTTFTPAPSAMAQTQATFEDENEVTVEEQTPSDIGKGWLIGGGVMLIVGLALIAVGIYALRARRGGRTGEDR